MHEIDAILKDILKQGQIWNFQVFTANMKLNLTCNWYLIFSPSNAMAVFLVHLQDTLFLTPLICHLQLERLQLTIRYLMSYI